MFLDAVFVSFRGGVFRPNHDSRIRAIPASSSTKNREQKSDPKMHQARKGKQWYFGMKAHFGADSKTKIIHTAVVTAANVFDAPVPIGALPEGVSASVNAGRNLSPCFEWSC
jgi:hypothetical protein